MVFAKTSGTQSVLAVTKPDAGSAAPTYLVSYGLELNAANEALGAAVYADPICLETSVVASLLWTPTAAAILGTNPWIPWYNCYNAVSDTTKNIVLAKAANTNGGQRGYVNAIEIAYTVPFKIPNDRTEGKVTCALSGTITTQKNWLNVHAASVMSTGFGIGSCWYFGKDTTENMTHRKVFLCRDLGEVASGSTQKLAFQFSIW